MPGFTLKKGMRGCKLENKDNYLSFISHRDIEIISTSINKFKDDNCFYECDDFIIVLDGVILNKSEFVKNNETWEKTIIKMYMEKGNSFYKQFRGSFSGLIYEKKKDKLIIFTDHIGSKHLYYYKLDDGFIFSSDIIEIYNFCKNNGIKNNLSVNSAYMLLSYGFMLEDNTLSENIKKVLPGNYIKIEKGNFSIHEYYRLTNKPNYDITENEVIEKMDYYFRQAIKRQFDKDKEYGFKHFVALSGGLDSRMTVIVAHEMGYVNQLNYTFSQSDYLDETIPKKIASDLKHEWIFKALDNGLFLKDMDEITRITGGNVLYYGLAHGLSLTKYINFSKLGINHSGQLGDVVFGTFYKSKNKEQKFKVGDGAYSRKFINKINYSDFENKYENQEIFNFYQRGFAGANYGLLATQQFTETMSPFYDIDLMEFALSIPVELRFNHYIYKKWILKKYPKAADYVWEKTKNKITTKTIKIKSKEFYCNQIIPLAKRKLKIGKTQLETQKHMNPLDYWLNNNMDLNIFFKDYYVKHIDLVEDKQLRDDVIKLFKEGNAIEKIEVLTLLSGIKRIKQQL